jgi:creatinine amidohydrolase
MKRALGAIVMVVAAAICLNAQPRDSRVLKLEELTWPRINALDRERTIFILTTGAVEEHGPHLPVGADTIGVAFEADGVSARISKALPQWRVVMMPAIPYGAGGANQIGGHLIHPGTYGIRQSTVRALIADLGGQVAQNGFKWIFVLTGHGSPENGRAINEACDFISETFGVTMLHVSGLFRADPAIQAEGLTIAERHFPAAEVSSFGLDVHAGPGETSAILALRPNLVDPGYKTLPSNAGSTFEELQAIAKKPGWQGYLSAPGKSTAAYGRAVEDWWVDGMSALILRAIKGENMLKAPRAHDRIDPTVAAILGPPLENERAFAAKLDAWLASRRPQ